MTKRKCQVCGKIFFTRLRPETGHKGLYCGCKCMGRAMQGEQIKKICLKCGKEFFVCPSENKYNSCKFCSQECYHNYPRSQEFRDKISKKFRDAGHPRWKGGIMKGRKDRNLTEYKNWRKTVFERDNYTCQNCGIKNCKGLGKSISLNAHHIKSWTKFPELRYKVENGTTLCETCHDKTRAKLNFKE